MKKFWYYIWSWPNIIGMSVAIVGLVVHLFLQLFSEAGGLPFWYMIILGLYAFGYLFGYVFQNNEAQLRFYYEQQDIDDIRDALKNLLDKTRNRLAPHLFTRISHICERIDSVLPSLIAAHTINEDLFTVKQTVFDYLPAMIERYLQLPTPYARMHRLDDGKTAQQLLEEQIILIDNSIEKIVNNLYSDDINTLRINERFLRERLGIYDDRQRLIKD